MANEIYAHFDTTEGKFKVRLFTVKATLTVANFVSLADEPRPASLSMMEPSFTA